MSITGLINTRLIQAGSLAVVIMLAFGAVRFANDQHTSGKFEGAKANIGTVTHSKQGNMNVLSLSNDFVVPDTPAPHWQVVDSNGNVYLLQRLKIKGDKFNQTITVPPYVKDIAKVQIWCAFAETLLGEAKFATPVK
jgi:hypothetical protein